MNEQNNERGGGGGAASYPRSGGEAFYQSRSEDITTQPLAALTHVK